ncbi:MAG TPA: type II toxin-antitoxin system HicA family toxin [Candidatus Hydrogenedentes bacterium]|nr:type II toxin-antitoxin system HicA family toxin [Candidatus Hydrogenedentota bacterium]
MNKEKLLKKLLRGSKNVKFSELIAVVQAFGFTLARVRGSHHIFEHPDIPELLNLQEYKGEAKPYQIEQFLALVEEYNLTIQEKNQ